MKMEFWFLIAVTAVLFIFAFRLFKRGQKRSPLPPGPACFPFIGNLVWLRKPLSEMEFILRRMRTLYGPIITMRIGTRPFIFIGNHSLAHRALIQNGAVFSDRPGPTIVSKYLNRNRFSINSAPYGPTWRLLRRNLTQEILSPARVKAYSGSRRWVLSILIGRLATAAASESSTVKVMDHFHFAMFCLLVLMCFGDRLSETQIKEVETVQRRILVSFRRFNRLLFLPRLSRFLFRKTWNAMIELLGEQERVLIPLIRARIQQSKNTPGKNDDRDRVLAYVDTLIDLEHPEKKTKLGESEMLTLCSEFLNAGTDTTSTALQWLMANLVKHPHYQDKLYQEIAEVMNGPPPPITRNGLEKVVEEQDLERMPYLKAVVLEALRRHPPGHFVLPHKVTEDVELDGYTIPKNSLVNFMVADMGWDPKVWDDPMEFKPKRFLSGEGEVAFDITGKREIKMMPFGAGRRMCPGLGLALLHLEYFVANLIWYFDWSPIDDVDLTEKQEFTTVMKYPLQARISPRSIS